MGSKQKNINSLCFAKIKGLSLHQPTHHCFLVIDPAQVAPDGGDRFDIGDD